MNKEKKRLKNKRQKARKAAFSFVKIKIIVLLTVKSIKGDEKILSKV